MNIKQLSSDGKIAYLIKPILKVLQEAGGQLERSEIKARINYVPIVDSAVIKTSVKARIENILEQARNGEI